MLYSYSTDETEPGLKPITVFSFLLRLKDSTPGNRAIARMGNAMELGRPRRIGPTARQQFTQTAKS
jgi:hypothetical protein